MSFTEGFMDIGVKSKIFYPSHGAGTIVKEKTIEFAGELKKYFEFSFINKKLTISTPVQNLDKIGVRPVQTIDEINKQIKVLKKNPSLDPEVPSYNDLIVKITDLDQKGEVDSFIRIIQYCNFEKEQRVKEGRLIPVSITKYVKNAISNLVGEMAVTQGIEFDEAERQFEKLTGIEIDS